MRSKGLDLQNHIEDGDPAAVGFHQFAQGGSHVDTFRLWERLPYKRPENHAIRASKSVVNSCSGVFSSPGSRTVNVTPKQENSLWAGSQGTPYHGC